MLVARWTIRGSKAHERAANTFRYSTANLRTYWVAIAASVAQCEADVTSTHLGQQLISANSEYQKLVRDARF